MAYKNPEVDYKAEEASIREAYVKAAPGARLHVIEERLTNLDSLPNRLVNAVSAVEGFSRALLVDLLKRRGRDAGAAYKKYKYKNHVELINELLRLKCIEDVDSYFGEDTWELLGFAADYRNLVAHECTYVGQDKAPSMIQACHDALIKLTELAGVRNYKPPF